MADRPPRARQPERALGAQVLLSVGAFDGARLVGIASLVEPPAGPPEVSVLVDPAARGAGVAERLEKDLVARAAGHCPWVQHRTVEEDLVSQRLAVRCGFRLVSVEHLVRPQAAEA